jgi:predicted Zn-dependent protease
MRKTIILNIFSGTLLLLFSCTETSEQKKTIATTNADSLKVFFYNLSKKGIDSLNSVISSEIMTSKGVDLTKLFQNLSVKDSLGYEYYANYAYLLALKKGNPVEALKYLDLGVDKAKDKSRFYFDKALMWAYIQPLKERDTVYKYLDLAIYSDSLNPFYYGVRSQFRNEDGQYDLAMLDINQAINLDPSDTSFVNGRGSYKIQFQDWEGALQDLKDISYQNKNNAYVYMYRAMANHKLKKYKNVLEEANKCLNLNPNIGVVYSIRGNAKLHLGDEEGGYADVKKGAKLGDKDAIEFLKKYEERKRSHSEV